MEQTSKVKLFAAEMSHNVIIFCVAAVTFNLVTTTRDDASLYMSRQQQFKCVILKVHWRRH